MRWTGTKALPSDVESWVQNQQPPVIVGAIVPPEGFIQARYLCQRLHMSSPGSQIIIAYYGKLRSYDSMLIKFRSVGATFFSNRSARLALKSLVAWSVTNACVRAPRNLLVREVRPDAQNTSSRRQSRHAGNCWCSTCSDMDSPSSRPMMAPKALRLQPRNGPDLILMDVNNALTGWMGRHSSDSFFGWLGTIAGHRADSPRYQRRPRLALEAGCIDYHSKPVEFPKLLQQIEQALRAMQTLDLRTPANATEGQRVQLRIVFFPAVHE